MDRKNGSALILIVLGLIIIAFPVLGVVPFSVLTGLAVSIFRCRSYNSWFNHIG